MNSSFLRLTAGLMIVAAIITAWFGYRISNKKPADTINVVVPTYPQVVARIDIPVGHTLTTDDMDIVNSQQRSDDTFTDIQDLLGKTTAKAVSKGNKLKISHFPNNSLLAQTLASDERAVAIKVNEVIGVGGYIKPGDHVDVLFYLRANQENGEISSAQIVLENVKVLAYGELISDLESKEDNDSTSNSQNKLGVSKRNSDIKKEKDSRSAILAVPFQDVSKLMLADSTGVLRLALRGTNLNTQTSTAYNNQLINLSEVSQPQDIKLQDKDIVIADKIKSVEKKKSVPTASKRVRVFVHRGDSVEVINVTR